MGIPLYLKETGGFLPDLVFFHTSYWDFAYQRSLYTQSVQLVEEFNDRSSNTWKNHLGFYQNQLRQRLLDIQRQLLNISSATHHKITFGIRTSVFSTNPPDTASSHCWLSKDDRKELFHGYNEITRDL